MATYLTVPKLGMALANATVVEWKVAEGDRVDKGLPVVTIETQKTKFDMETEEAGFVHILVAPDTEVAVGRVVGIIASTSEELAAIQKEPIREITVPTPGAGETMAPATGPVSPTPTVSRVGDRDTGHVRISPVARKLAEEHMIDISKVAGTGPEGRIVREDIEKAIEEQRSRSTDKTYDGRKVKETVPLKGMRKAIAEHMQRSLAISAQLTAIGEVDMSALIKRRKGLMDATPGAHVSFTDAIVFVLSRVLPEFPRVNSSLIENEIQLWESVNVGVAVALEDGLIVPVVKDADKKSLLEISSDVSALAAKAREGKLTPEEVTGGTFTLTNLGAAGAGWRFETAIINQPESAILGTGGITDRAVVRDGQIVVRPMMTYSFTYDHRVIDGAIAVKFMARVIESLENPEILSV